MCIKIRITTSDDMRPKYEAVMSEINKEADKNLILWPGLKHLYCAKRLQHIEHFPSDIVWINKTKNVYLLEIDRAIKEKKWREWLNICYGVITPMDNVNKKDSNGKDSQMRIDGGPIPPNPDFVIDSKALKSLVPFLIGQTVNDKHLEQNVLQKLTAAHSEKILKQFRDRIERSDIKYITHQRNEYITKSGNNPLQALSVYDAQFTETINAKLNELSKIDKSLAQKFRECWTESDDAFISFTTPKTEQNVSNKYNEENILCWDHEKDCLSMIDEMTENEEKDDTAPAGKDEIIFKSLRYFVDKVPSSYRTHHNLLRHTIDDCAKCAMLDPDLLKEGYCGDNGHPKWGLWKANNLPIITLREHLLTLRDIICNEDETGAYVEICGKYGTGKSLALMYAVNVGRAMDMLCIYCPDTHEWVQKVELAVPANDKEAVFYQHGYARQFFKNLKVAESEKLKNIPLSNEYNFSYRAKEENKKEEKKDRVDLDMVYSMLEDPVDIKKYEEKIMNEWMKIGASYCEKDGAFTMSDKNNKFETLYDMMEYGLSADCESPASLLYDFMDEIKKQRVYKVLIACDGVTFWNDFVYGLTTPRNPKVFAWQLSMIDIFSQFQQKNALQNGLVVMSRTTMGKHRAWQMKTNPSHYIRCPEVLTNDEFDSLMWGYQGVKLCSPNIAPDDYKKVYAASARRPIFAQRIAALY